MLDITTDNASFDRIYSRLLNAGAESKLDLDSITNLFVPTYSAYLSYLNLEKVLPPEFSDEEGRLDREALTAYYEKNVYAAHLAKQISSSSVATMIESLPDVNVGRRHMVMLLEPKFSKVILSPSKAGDDDDDEEEEDGGGVGGSTGGGGGDAIAGEAKVGAVTKSAVEAAFQIINVNHKKTMNRKELITALRDNKLIQRLLQLPTKNHAHYNRWKKMMAKLNSGRYEDCGLPEFISLFEGVAEDIDLEEKKMEERKRRGSLSRRNSKEAQGVVVKKEVREC